MAESVRVGRKVVDKEGEIYEKLLLMAQAKEHARRSPGKVYKQETLLFKGPAVKLAAFLAKRNIDKKEIQERLRNFEFQPTQSFSP